MGRLDRDPTDPPQAAPPADAGQAQKRPRERVLWNTAAILIGNALASVSHGVVELIMGKHLVGRPWGVFSYVRSWIDMFRVVANFGLDQVAIRTMAIGKYSPRAVLRHLLLLNAAMLGVVLLLIIGLSLVVESFREHRDLFLLMAGSLLPLVFTQSAVVRFQVEHTMDRLIPVRAVTGLFYFGAVWAAAAAGQELTTFVLIYLVYQWVVLGFTLGADHLTWRRDGTERLWGPISPTLTWTILRQGIPAGLEALVVVLYQRLGAEFLKRYQGYVSVGQYYMAVKITEPLQMIPSALAVSAFPVLTRLADGGEIPELKRRFAVYSLRSLAPSILLALILTFFGPALLTWYEAKYAPAGGALIALSWAVAVIFQNALTVTMVKAFGKFHYVTAFATINLFVFLGLSLWLVPSHGTTGAGLSTLGTESVNCLFHFVAVFYLMRKAARNGGQV